ncbi:Pre-mRNA splicing factor ATP-dependent RNA helicase PRP22 [Aphelenchoides avenae]|nr:Pre-mRNA splicing factor ATP-dependent RNA helicase PRP22 [Aphelenchus avenae]
MSGAAVRAGPPAALRPAEVMQRRRRALPIYRYRAQIINTMYNSQVVILRGGTGSGKTTQLVQYILEETRTLALQGQNIQGLIGCTQPRVIATMASARRVAQELGCRVGEEVGYRVRFDNSSSDRTRIVFLTDGILVQELLGDPLLTKYSFIILDEAHVRSVNLDFLLPMLRMTLRRRGGISLLISSATIDADRFADYFGAPGPISSSLSIPAPIILVDGQNYTVEVIYDASIYSAVDVYMEDPKMRKRSEHALAAALKVKELVRGADMGDILVFLPGQEEIEECCYELSIPFVPMAPLDVRPLFGALPSHLQNDALKPAHAGRRKVVVATNIAETSLTIDGIVHVIDTGVAKEPRFDPETGFHFIVETKISKYSAIQRAGRAGRTAPGKCYRLYSQEQYDTMPTSDSAEMTRADLAETLLRMSKLNITDVLNFPFMEKPSIPYYVRALDDLVAMGALDAESRTLTPHGEMIMKLALEPCLANALIRSAEYGCSEEMLVIVALISVDCAKVFYKPQDKLFTQLAVEMRAELKSHAGDHLTLLNVYREWTGVGDCGQQWCDDNFVYFQTMVNAKACLGGAVATNSNAFKPLWRRASPTKRRGDGVYAWLADKPQLFKKKVKVVASMDSDLHQCPRKLVICYKVVVSGSSRKRQMQLVTEVQRDMLPESVRAKVPEDKPWTPGDDLWQAWLDSKNASEASARREFSLENDDDGLW